MDGLADGLMLVAAVSIVAAAAFDIARFIIPDTLSLAVLVAGIGHSAVTGGGLPSHMAAPLVMLAAGMAVFQAGAMGGGDVKLLVGVAAWSGLEGLLPVAAAVSVAGGVLAIGVVLARHVAVAVAIARPRVLQQGAPLPYGVAIAVGSLGWAASSTVFLR